MSSGVNTESGLTPELKAVIWQGVLERKDWRAVYDEACAVRPVTQRLVKETMEKLAAEFSGRVEAKREGTLIVREFLRKAAEGADVDDMAAVLEQAVYRDLLRRYSESGDPLGPMTVEQLLKIDLSYRSARAARTRRESKTSDARASRLAARVCLETFDKVAQLLGEGARGRLERIKKPLVDWASKTYGEENVSELMKERNEIEKLASLVRGKGRRGHHKRETRPRHAARLAV